MPNSAPPPAARPRARSGGFVSVGIVVTLLGAMVATLLGAGAFRNAFDVSDGNAWLWSSKPGTASRVNANSGRVDMRQPLVDARGHRVRITQNDKYLILHDLDTGRVTSVDLTRMGFTGTLNVGADSDISVVLHEDSAAIVDRGKGLVRGLDPVTLRTSKDVLRLPPPIAGGAYDADGRLWLAVPSEGTVVAATVDQDTTRADRTEVVAEPGGQLALTALDHGAFVVDRSGGRLTVVGEDSITSVRAPGDLADAQVPPRTVGDTVAITSVEDHSVTVVRLGGEKLEPVRFEIPPGVDPGVAVPYAGRIYVPDAGHATVLVFTPGGKPLDPVELAGAEGDLELEVREGRLFINSPDTSVARVVDSDGDTRKVDKYRQDVAGGKGMNGHVRPRPDRGGDSEGEQRQGPPGPPVPVTAVAGDEQVRLSWGAAAANGARVEYYEVTWDGGSRTVRGGTRTVVKGLENGSTYTFGVRAHNRFGDGPPALSEPVTPSDQIPDPPRNVRAEVVPDDGAVSVTWDPVAGARDYVVTALRDGAPDPAVPPTRVSGPEAVVRGLTYGQPYRFTVTARNDSGAGSEPSRPSNQVTPYAAPGKPRNPRASGTGANQVTVRWDAAPDHGDPITGYVIKASTGKSVTVGGDARRAELNGLPTGKTVTFEITARNRAGAGPPATASARVGQAPTVRIDRITRDYRTLAVEFTVNGHGMATSCRARVKGGSSVSGNCSKITIRGLRAGTAYTVEVTATNDIGSGTDSQAASTKRLWGTVRCKNGPSGEQRTYCNNGISVKSSPREGATTTRKVPDGKRLRAVCKVPDADGETHYAYVYNNEKRSKWWIRLPDGGYIMHVWLNLDAGDGDTANLAILRRC